MNSNLTPRFCWNGSSKHMFGYMTFNVKYYILSKKFIKKSGECLFQKTLILKSLQARSVVLLRLNVTFWISKTLTCIYYYLLVPRLFFTRGKNQVKSCFRQQNCNRNIPHLLPILDGLLKKNKINYQSSNLNEVFFLTCHNN